MDKKQTLALLGRLPRLIGGLVLMGFASALQVQANLGYGSWTVLNHGLTNYLPLTLGNASIMVSAIVIGIDLLAREKIGVGMIFNMFIVGRLLDVFRPIIPAMPGFSLSDPVGTAMSIGVMLLGLTLMSLSAIIYMGAGLGAGPRDTLMVAVMKWTGKDIAICRNSLELMALGVGWLLGGSVGVGTIMVALLSGPIMQTISRMMKFNPKAIRHITFDMLPGVLSGRIPIDAELPAAEPEHSRV